MGIEPTTSGVWALEASAISLCWVCSNTAHEIVQDEVFYFMLLLFQLVNFNLGVLLTLEAQFYCLSLNGLLKFLLSGHQATKTSQDPPPTSLPPTSNFRSDADSSSDKSVDSKRSSGSTWRQKWSRKFSARCRASRSSSTLQRRSSKKAIKVNFAVLWASCSYVYIVSTSARVLLRVSN